jgi:hypothetical protein
VTDTPRRAPTGVDTTAPNIARMNDYFLGGKDNFAADREAADQVLAIAPEIKEMAEEIRDFLGRTVRYLASKGIRQFIDIGAGLPTQRNTHEVARSQMPDARVVYVDSDPVVLSHARAILVDSARTSVLEGDVRHPAEIVADCREHDLIDFDRPVAVLIFTALHFIPHSDDPFKAIARLRDELPAGSHPRRSTAVLRRFQAGGPRSGLHPPVASGQSAEGPSPQEGLDGRRRRPQVLARGPPAG